MTLEKQIELLKEWRERAEMYLPIMSSEDIERFLRWLEDYKQLKEDYTDLDNRLRTANTENDELKRLLRLAVDDFDKLANVESCYYPFCGERCPFDCAGGCEEREWKHRDEAMKLLGGTEEEAAKGDDQQ